MESLETVEVRGNQMAAPDISEAMWRKSAHSNINGCVEVALLGDAVAVRNSRDRRGPVVVFTALEWEAFIGGAKDGEFDLGRVTHSGRRFECECDLSDPADSGRRTCRHRWRLHDCGISGLDPNVVYIENQIDGECA
jgi:Domain of unknown function (DUF397)